MKRQEIINELMKNNSTLLSFPDRGSWGSNSYRGNCSGWIQAFCIWKYKVRKLAELFAGSGTGSDVAKDMEIDYIGADLNPNPVRPDILSVNALTDDVPDEFRTADFQFHHPPYGLEIGIPYCGYMYPDTNNLSDYDLGQMPWDDFMYNLNRIVMKYFSAMPNGSRMGILMGDVKRNGKLYSMISDIVKPGKLEQIIIKAQHNCWSEGRKYANANFVPIVHEYLMIIAKEEEMIIPYVLPVKFEKDIRDVNSSTWEDVVLAQLRYMGSSDFTNLYNILGKHKKAQGNPHYEAKIRQTIYSLRDKGLVMSNQRGCWRAVA